MKSFDGYDRIPSMDRSASTMMTQALVLIAAMPLIMGAASGTTLKTGTGSSMTGAVLTAKEADKENADREASVKTFAANIKEWYAMRSAWKVFSAQEDVSAMTDRTTCRAEIRQANRETILDTQVRCFRREMSTWRTRLLKEEAFLTRIPGLLPGMTAMVQQRSKDLREGINAVITALDNNVFKSEAQLLEVKRNLRSKFNQPLRVALDSMRRMELHLLTEWTITMMDQADDGTAIMDRASWDAARTCFTDREKIKDATVAADSAALIDCLNMAASALLQQVPPVQTGTGSTLKTQSGSTK